MSYFMGVIHSDYFTPQKTPFSLKCEMYVIGKKPFKVKEENKETYHETTRLYNILARILAPNPQQIRHSPTHSQQNDF